MTAGAPVRVLVVDDDYRVAKIHEAYVERTPGFTVCGRAHSAAQALEAVAELRPDLVLMDVYLPDGDGLGVMRKLLEAPVPEVPAVVRGGGAGVGAGLEAGFGIGPDTGLLEAPVPAGQAAGRSSGPGTDEGAGRGGVGLGTGLGAGLSTGLSTGPSTGFSTDLGAGQDGRAGGTAAALASASAAATAAAAIASAASAAAAGGSTATARAVPRPDFVVITAARDVNTVRTAMQLGAVHYLVKPFGYPAMAEKLASYRDLRRRIETLDSAAADADQSAVDELFGLLRTPVLPAQPSKGHSAPTLELVRNAVRAAGDVSAAEVAERVGISRPTAQRYLSYLTRHGVVRLHLRYGTTGRPEHRYSPVG